MKVYAGIGSRRAPPSVLATFETLARRRSTEEWVLRSGHAEGCDQAFARGALPLGQVVLFLPWGTFNAEDLPTGPTVSVFSHPTDEAYEFAEERFPWIRTSSRGVRALVARNMHQILGWDLKTPCDEVQFWAPTKPNGDVEGGTNYAVRVAREFGIPCHNLYTG